LTRALCLGLFLTLALAPAAQSAEPEAKLEQPVEKVAAPAAPAASVPTTEQIPAAPPPVAKAPLPEIELPPTELPDALKDDADGSLGFALFRTVVVLGLVLMIVWFSLNFGLRRLMGLKGPMGGASVVTVLERIPLDQKRSLFVIKAAGEYLLLGSGDGNLGLVSKLEAAEVERLLQRPQRAPVLSPLLEKLLKRNAKT
jgi:flagellar biogenesis protein FliO